MSLYATRISGRWITKGETKWSRPEVAYISGKGADDHIGLCVSSDLGL